MPTIRHRAAELDAVAAVPSARPAPAAVRAVATTRPDFEVFYRAEWAQAVRLAHLLGCGSRAEEVAQDAFVALHQHWERIERPGGYLRSAIVNRSRDRFRHKARWRTREHLLTTEADRASETKASEGGAIELLDLLRDLPARQRAALVLRYWGGLTEAEIAEALGVRPGTVKSLVHRGLERLRDAEGVHG